MPEQSAIKTRNRTLIRSVALPAEHGGWGFLIEPLLLGMLVAGSWQGFLLVIAAFGIFLLHQPLKVALKDRLKGRRPPRAVYAERFVLLYGAMAVLPMLILLTTMPPDFLLPLALAIPFALVQLVYDARNRSRRFLPELCGALALAMTAPAIVIMAGWQPVLALFLWVLLALRAFTAILYVRARLRLEHGNAITPVPVWSSHLLALILAAGMRLAGFVPSLSILVYAILLLRALVGLSQFRRPRPAKIIGFQEIGYGLLTVILIAIGYMRFF